MYDTHTRIYTNIYWTIIIYHQENRMLRMVILYSLTYQLNILGKSIHRFLWICAILTYIYIYALSLILSNHYFKIKQLYTHTHPRTHTYICNHLLVQVFQWFGTHIYSLFLSLSLSHAHTHTHSYAHIPWCSFIYLSIFISAPAHTYRGSTRGVMFKVLDCCFEVSEFELQSNYFVPFRTNTLGRGMNPLSSLAMG